MDPQPESGTPSAAASSPKRPRNRGLTVLLRICVAVALVAVLLLRTDVGQAFSIIRGAKPLLLLAALLVMAFPLAIGAFRWWLLLRALGLEYPYHFILRVHVSGYALSTILPTSMGGDLLRVGYASRRGTVERALSTVLTDRILGVAGLLVMSDVASILLWLHTGSPGLLALAGIATVFVVLVLLALVVKPVYDRFTGLAVRVRFLRLGERAVRVTDGVRQYRERPRLMVLSLCLSVLVWLVHSTVWFLLGVSVASTAPLVRYLVCVPIVALSTMLPISVGGIGVRENSFVILMGRFATPESTAVAVALLFLAVLAFYALVGALLVITLRWAHLNSGSGMKTSL